MNENEKRLNKFISETGICSRREADKLIENGRIKINGQVANVGTKVCDADKITIDGKLISAKPKTVYIALNKPKGITCTTEKNVKGNIVDFVNYKERIFPIGRLDKDSEGLIFLTNDGDIVNKILRAGNNHEKEYIVTVNKPISHNFLAQMESGVRILNTITKPCKIQKISNNVFNIVLVQGLNRQIRRMCEALDYKVTKLKRIRIMNVALGNIQTGKWRYITNNELVVINKSIEDSSKTEEASY